MTQEKEDQPSPLAEADLKSLSDLFSSDPFGFLRQDRARIVAELRRARANWQVEEKAGKKRASKTVLTPELLQGLKLG